MAPAAADAERGVGLAVDALKAAARTRRVQRRHISHVCFWCGVVTGYTRRFIQPTFESESIRSSEALSYLKWYFTCNMQSIGGTERTVCVLVRLFFRKREPCRGRTGAGGRARARAGQGGLRDSDDKHKGIFNDESVMTSKKTAELELELEMYTILQISIDCIDEMVLSEKTRCACTSFSSVFLWGAQLHLLPM